MHAALHRYGLVNPIGRRRNRDALSERSRLNDLWCADFKGEFKLGNGRHRYPLAPAGTDDETARADLSHP